MKRGHPDDQENVYPARRPPFHNSGLGGPVGFDRLRDGMPHPSQLAAPHIASVPGPTQNSQASSAGPVHAHPPTQTVHVQQAFPGHNQAGAAPQVSGQQHFQRLKVEDALSYLDQVKLQFGNQPQVYNEFLDIMKEFKSQTIDTPGVIRRVSTLFKGHPDLIVGFNTFLPPGYKIEVNMGEGISVTMQDGPGQTQQTHQLLAPGSVSTPQSMAQSVPTTQPSSFSPSQQPPPTQQTPPQSQPPAPQPPQPPPALASPGGGHSQTQAQHHAISYVTKIKNRFQGQPEVYQKFLDILNNYQTEQKAIKESAVDSYGRQLTDHEIYIREGDLANEVYQQVAKLFQNQEDLLQEFSQFLPDSGSAQSAYAAAQAASKADFNTQTKKVQAPIVKQKQALKKSSTPVTSAPTMTVKNEPLEPELKEPTDKLAKVPLPQKRQKSALKDVTLAEAVKHGSFSEFAFFDKVRKALKCQDVYENFLRCLVLFNNEVISRGELVQLASSFLGKSPELFTWFKMFLGYKENQVMDPVSGYKDRGTGSELAHLEIDYASCKRNGASYRALPKSYTQPKCSGRTPLCKEVLNDTWVSLPSWSEDTQFPGTRKTQYEEYIYKCEDERFELDVVIETNLSAIKVLETVQKKLNRMSSDEQQKFRLDNTLGGSSEVIYKKAIYRIYGDKAPEIIDGLKKTPHVAVPLVLKRLKAKDEEWHEAQKQFNKIWREQNEKYYLKSLDHQGINYKQTDTRFMRSKSLIHDIEQLFEERSDQVEEGNVEAAGPQLVFTYQDKSILDDAASLIVHHMKRQTSIHKDDKLKIKQLLYQMIPDFFFAPRGDLSDDEDKDQVVKSDGPNHNPDVDDVYNLFFGNNNWYVFLRLHQLLCERLLKLYQLAMSIAENEAQDMKHRKEGTAVALRLRQPDSIDAEEYYPAFLDMVRNLLDGNMDSIAYEDSCRELFGVNSYVVFTIDKLIQNIVRQLQYLVSDDTCTQMTSLYRQEMLQCATGGPTSTATLRFSAEGAYQKKAENMLSDENCFKIVFLKEKTTSRMSIELLPTDDDQSEDPVELERWSEYVDKFVGSSDVPSEVKDHLVKKPIFLLRNARYLQSRSPTSEFSAAKRTNVDHDEKGSSTDEAESNGVDSPRPKVEGASDPVLKGIISEDNLVFKLSVNSYKMVYVAGTGGYMYRMKSLYRALKSHPKVNEKLHRKFQRWHSQWLTDNVSREQARTTDDWLMGKQEALKSTVTVRNTFKQSGLICNVYSIKHNAKDTQSK